jgi:hypothetical protein
VLALDDDGKVVKDVQKVVLQGHVLTSPMEEGRQFVAVTDAGHIKVMGVNASNVEQPLADLAEQPAPTKIQTLLRHLLLKKGNLWIADNRLARYQVQSAAGRLLPSPLKDDYVNASFQQPLIATNEALIHARKPFGAASILIAGTSLDDGSKLWETQVGTPTASEPIVRDAVIAATAAGQLFAISVDDLTQHAIDQLASRNFDIGDSVLLASRADLPDGSAIYAPAGGDTRMLLVSPKVGRSGKLLTSPEPLACAPSAFGKGLIVPTSIGQVFWLNPITGKPVALPFQPQLVAGASVKWTTPDTTNDGREFVITDGARVYRVGLARDPSPHLAALATSEELPQSLVTPIAVVNSIAMAANDAGELRVFKLPDLSIEEPVDLGASVVWGPRRLGNYVLMTTSNEELICLDGDAKIVWRKSLEHGPIAGNPALKGEELAISTLSGQLARLSMADGRTLGVTDVGQPLAAGPVEMAKRWLVATKDGTLLLVNAPADGSGNAELGAAQ